MSKGINPVDRSAWEQRGGRIRIDAKGRPVFVIRKQVGGRRYEVSTRKHTLKAALAEWERFEQDPEGYAPGGSAATEPIYLDNDLCRDFLAWSLKEKGNTPEWVSKQKTMLAWWMEQLRGVNLRRATLGDHIDPALENATGKRQRIEVIRALYGWLRKVGAPVPGQKEKRRITAHEDPTYGALPVPQPRAAQLEKSRVIPRDHYLLAREHLVGPWRDALDVLAGTGWHITELIRFANAGNVEPLPKERLKDGAAGVLVCPRHKLGDVHRTAVSADVLEAGRRLRDRGWPAESKFPFYDAIESACRVAKIPAFSPGGFRHSVATWAIEAGAPVAAVAAFLGHRSPATTRKFYATHATVPKVPTLA
jgi:integrase